VTCSDVSCADLCAELRSRCPHSPGLLACANYTGITFTPTEFTSSHFLSALVL